MIESGGVLRPLPHAGEGPGATMLAMPAPFEAPSLSPTLSPEREGENTMGRCPVFAAPYFSICTDPLTVTVTWALPPSIGTGAASAAAIAALAYMRGIGVTAPASPTCTLRIV